MTYADIPHNDKTIDIEAVLVLSDYLEDCDDPLAAEALRSLVKQNKQPQRCNISPSKELEYAYCWLNESRSEKIYEGAPELPDDFFTTEVGDEYKVGMIKPSNMPHSFREFQFPLLEHALAWYVERYKQLKKENKL